MRILTRARVIVAGLLFMISCGGMGLTGSLRSPRAVAADTIGHGYLLLVNTAIASQMDEAKFRQFGKSPYDGLAVAFVHAYDTSAIPPAADMAAKLREWRKICGKDIWPWVYVNRIIAMNPSENNPHSDTPYFRGIAGADLDDARGAQSDYLRLWRNSLAAARQAGSPGIVGDLEFYNNYKEYDIGELAKELQKTPADAATRLQALGTRMADIANEEYPQAKLWFLFTGFTHAGFKSYDGVAYYPSPTYIAMGMLDEIVRKNMSLTVLTGGEGSLGYCHESVAEFRAALDRRAVALKPVLAKYDGRLEMAGTMTLWSDRAGKKGWVNEGACKTASAATAEELRPYLELLLNTYEYNWIYASPDGSYLAFSSESAGRFDAVIQQARRNASH